MSYSLVNWAYLTPMTADRFNQMEENSVRTSEHKIWGVECNTNGQGTINVNGGRVELDGKWLSRNGGVGDRTGLSLTATEATAWYSQSGGNQATSTAYYVVAYNDSGGSFTCKFRLAPPAYSDTTSGTASGPKIYDKDGTTWLRYIGVAYNASGGGFREYQQKGDSLWYVNLSSAGGQVTAYSFSAGNTSYTPIDFAPLTTELTRGVKLAIKVNSSTLLVVAPPHSGSNDNYAGNRIACDSQTTVRFDIPWVDLLSGTSSARQYGVGAGSVTTGIITAERLWGR